MYSRFRLSFLLLIFLSSHLFAEASFNIDNISFSPGSGETAYLKITSIPDLSKVYIDGNYSGRTPYNEQLPAQGQHRIEIKKAGYTDLSFWIDCRNNSHIEIKAELERIEGMVDIEVSPADADIFISGSKYGVGEHNLPAGLYSVHIRKFGYEDYNSQILITGEEPVILNAVLKKADFRLASLSTDKRVFNPHNSGILGSMKVDFAVTSEGAGYAEIISAGRTVKTIDFEEFSGRNNNFIWDGSDDEGNTLDDGLYTIKIEVVSADSKESDTEEVEIEIDSSIYYFPAVISISGSGLSSCPATECLPTGVFQLSSGISLLDFSSPDIEIPAYIRYSVIERLELAFRLSVLINSTGEREPSGTGIALLNFRITDFIEMFSLNGIISGGYTNSADAELQSDYCRIGFNLPLELSTGTQKLPFSFVLAPSLYWNYMEEQKFHAGLSAGAIVKAVNWSTGLSGRLETGRFGEEFTSAGAVSTAVDFSYFLPGLPAVAGLHFIMDIIPEAVYSTGISVNLFN